MEQFKKLIIIRGSSASGKTTTARKLRESYEGSIALIEQDYIRRTLLKEKDRPGASNIELIYKIARHALEDGFDVILEGILYVKHYRDMLFALRDFHQGKTFSYYFDLPFEETLKRYQGSSKVNRFTVEDLRKWYEPKDFLGFEGEVALTQEKKLPEILEQMLRDIS